MPDGRIATLTCRREIGESVQWDRGRLGRGAARDRSGVQAEAGQALPVCFARPVAIETNTRRCLGAFDAKTK